MEIKIKKGLLFTALCFILIFSGLSSSEEIYRWKDNEGKIHFTDDTSKIPEKYLDQAKKIEWKWENQKEENSQKKDNSLPVKIYLEDIEKRIEEKKKIEKRILELEYELKLSEERLHKIEEYEKENYIYYMPYKDRKTGKWVKVVSPYYEEKRFLSVKIESIREEIKALYQELSKLNRNL